MKSCPTCKRTYADDSITFCLIDGAILSASYDPEATQIIPDLHSTDLPPTEIQTSENATLLSRTFSLEHPDSKMMGADEQKHPTSLKKWMVRGLFIGPSIGLILFPILALILDHHTDTTKLEKILIGLAAGFVYGIVGGPLLLFLVIGLGRLLRKTFKYAWKD